MNPVQTKSIPDLRFSEFDGDWEKRKLEEDITLISGLHLAPDEYNLAAGAIPYFTGPSDFTNDEDALSKWTDKVKNCAVQGDILFTVKGSGVGTLMLLELQKVALGRQLMAIRSSTASTACIYHFLLTKSHQFESLAKGNMIPGLTRDDILSTKLYLPQLDEQQKITDFLTAVDKRIQQLEEKKRLFIEYKKGVMQKIFSQQIRFTDDNGQPYPDWEEKRLGDVVEFKSTNSLSRDAMNYEDGQVYNIHYGDIHTKFKFNFHLGNEDVPYINGDIDISKVAEDCFCQAGDLVIADASEDYKDIGKAIEIIDVDGKRLLAGLHTYLARPKEGRVVGGFLGYLMQVESVRLQIMRLAQGISVLGISKGNIAKVKVQLPDVEEQRKVADFLTSIDTKIEQVASQHEQAIAFKKGLLQQMFV